MLLIAPTPEPLTPAATGVELNLAKPAAFRVLFYEMCRYGRREISGRSILVSGSRGAGKTTLVRLAIEMAAREANLRARPVLVGLHGPDLFAPAPETSDSQKSEKEKQRTADEKAKQQDATGSTPNDSSSETPTTPSEPTPHLNPVADAALRMITKALYRVYVDELGRAFSRHATDFLSSPYAYNRPVEEGKAKQYRELAASLQIALDWAPDLTVLRQYWKRLGVLDSGVLSRGGMQGYGATGEALRRGQGSLELLAAVTARDAFRLVTGRVKRTESSSNKGALKETRAKGFDFKGLFNPLLGLLTGGLVGGAMIQGSAGPVATALSAVATAVATNLTLNYTSTRTIDITRNKGEDFTWDTSLGSLDRMLPSLLDRILEAGLAPIFVVDELDKIDGLEKKMVDLVRHLKHIVTERAFFCFLTNRDYFEHVEKLGSEGDYGPEHTFFTHRLFVTFEPAELRGFVSDVIQIVAPQHSEDPVDALVLPYILTHFARLHPIDLHRSISQITRADGSVSLEPGEPRQPGYRNAAFYQLVVEYILQTPALNQRIHLEPEFRRLAHDALYYLAWNWCADGTRELELGIQPFARYLTKRSGGKLQFPDKAAELQTNRDIQILHAAMMQLVTFLAEPGTFRALLEKEALKEQTEPAFRIDSRLTEIPTSADEKPLLRQKIEGDRSYAAFVFDAYGELLEDTAAAAPVTTTKVETVKETPQPPAQPLQPDAAGQRIADIRMLNEFIKEICGRQYDLGTVANDWGIIESTPAWTQVQQAISRKEQPGGTTPAQKTADEDTIGRYYSMLSRCASGLKTSLMIASFLSAYVSEGSGSGFGKCLAVISDQLALRRRTPDQRVDKLGAIFRDFRSLIDGPEDSYLKMNQVLADASFPIDLQRLRECLAPTWKPTAIPDLDQYRFVRWGTEVLKGMQQDGWFYDAQPMDLVAAARLPTPFRADVSSMSATDWASLFAYITKASPELAQVPLFALLSYLGCEIEPPAAAKAHFPATVPSKRSPPSTRVLLLLDPERSIATTWKLDRTMSYGVVPVLASNLKEFAGTWNFRKSNPLGDLRINWILAERTAVTHSFTSLIDSVFPNRSSLPLFLLTERDVAEPPLEIRASSVNAAFESMRAIGAETGIKNWGRLAPQSVVTSPMSTPPSPGGALELVLIDGNKFGEGWHFWLDEEKFETRYGDTAAVTNVRPGKRVLRIGAEDAEGNKVQTERIVTITPDEVTRVELALRPAPQKTS